MHKQDPAIIQAASETTQDVIQVMAEAQIPPKESNTHHRKHKCQNKWTSFEEIDIHWNIGELLNYWTLRWR